MERTERYIGEVYVMPLKLLRHVYNLTRMLLLISITQVVLLTFHASAEGETSFRVLLPDPNVDILPHWEDEIVVGVVGAASPDLALFSVSQVIQWANWARTPAVYYKNIFHEGNSNERVARKINYLIHFGAPQDIEVSDPIVLGENVLSLISSDVDQALGSLLERELNPISKGCFVARATESGNVLRANVISIHTSLSEDEIKTCLDFAVLGSLGLHPSILEREFFVGESQERIVVDDYSNPMVFLSSAAACIKDAGIYDPQCAASIAADVLEAHGNAAR